MFDVDIIRTKRWVKRVEKGLMMGPYLYFVTLSLCAPVNVLPQISKEIVLSINILFLLIISVGLFVTAWAGKRVIRAQSKLTRYENIGNALNSAGVVIVIVFAQPDFRDEDKMNELCEKVYDNLQKLGVRCQKSVTGYKCVPTIHNPFTHTLLAKQMANNYNCSLVLFIRRPRTDILGYSLMNAEGNSVLTRTEEVGIRHHHRYFSTSKIAQIIAEGVFVSVKCSPWIQSSGPLQKYC